MLLRAGRCLHGGWDTEVPAEADWCLRGLVAAWSPQGLHLCWEEAPGVWKIWPAKPVLAKTGNEKLVVRSGGPHTDSDGFLG